MLVVRNLEVQINRTNIGGYWNPIDVQRRCEEATPDTFRLTIVLADNNIINVALFLCLSGGFTD